MEPFFSSTEFMINRCAQAVLCKVNAVAEWTIDARLPEGSGRRL
jgi:hypothetical protein